MAQSVRGLEIRWYTIVSDLGERKKELEHVREALGYNGYPDWLLAQTREEIKEKKREEEETTTVTTGVKREDKKRPVIIPYIRGFSEELENFGEIRYTNPEEGCRDGRKLCKLSEHFYPVIMVKNICMY